jgi:hypothetical protein
MRYCAKTGSIDEYSILLNPASVSAETEQQIASTPMQVQTSDGIFISQPTVKQAHRPLARRRALGARQCSGLALGPPPPLL